MQFRDSSIATHFGRGIIAGVDSSHGVRIEGGSTGGLIEPVGDDANISLTIRAKGTGGVSFGAASTATLQSFRRVRVDFTVPAMAVNAGAEIGDIAVAGLTTNAVITLAQRGPYNSSVAGVKANAYCSTAGQIHIELQNAGTTISGSTMSAYAMIHEFNVPA
jgi:hypothetical protein